MFALNLNEEKQILSAAPDEFAPSDWPRVESLPDGDISLYRYEDEQYVEDAERKAAREAAEKAAHIAELTAQLRTTDPYIIDAFESLLGVFKDSTALTLVANIIKWSVTELATLKTVLEQREKLREEIGE